MGFYEDLIRDITSNRCKNKDCLIDIDLGKSIMQYGVIALHGEDGGYIGWTCPHCEKTTLNYHKKRPFNKIKKRERIFERKPPYENPHFRYDSFPYTLRNIDPDLDVNINGLVTKADYITFKDIEIYLDGDPGGYCSYGFSDTTMGPRVAIYWFSEEHIKTNLKIENEKGIKVFPRYYFYEPIYDYIEYLCYDYYMSQFMDLKFPGSLARHIPFNPKNKMKRNIFKNIKFMNIIDYIVQDEIDTPEDNLLNLMDVTMPEQGGYTASERIDDINTQDRKISLRQRQSVLDFLWDNFARKEVQDLLDRKSTMFILDYLEMAKAPNLSFARIFSLRDRYLFDIYQSLRKIDLSERVNSIYPEGKHWTINFKGKVIRGLQGNGFKYLHYLVSHKNQLFSTDELNSIEGENNVAAMANSADDDNLSYINSLGITNDTIGDIQILSDIKKKIDQINNEILEAQSNNDLGRTEILNNEKEILYKYLDQYQGKGKHMKYFNSESKKVQRRITKSLERAIKQIIRLDKKIGEHFSVSITPINSFTLSYHPSEDIEWELFDHH